MKKREQYDELLQGARITQRAVSERVFTCVGCGRRVVSDGTPRTRAFVWTVIKTNKQHKYCYSCDDKLIQGVM